MTNNRYQKGSTFERTIRDHLGTFGYVTVKAAGSKGDTKADLVSFHPTGRILLVQCKTNGIISAEEWNRIYEVASWSTSTLAIIAEKPARGKIAYWRITGERVSYKPHMNRVAFVPTVNLDPISLDS